jgi:DNA polymerase/3'-5' exonuclease PolX
MPVRNAEIADLFDRMAALLEIQGANPFRVRAYRNAAQTLGGLPRRVADMLAEQEDLTRLPGIGKDLAGKIAELVDTGHLAALEELEKEVPAALVDLTRLPGLGPKRVKVLHAELGIRDLAELERAARKHRIRELAGFGAKTEQRILEALSRHAPEERRQQLADVEEVASFYVDYLQAIPSVKDVVVAGSYRRRKETVGDLDILVTCKTGSPVMKGFVEYDEVDEVVSRGTTRGTVLLRSGLQVDLRVVAQVSYGAALYYFTGSKAHSDATDGHNSLREMAGAAKKLGYVYLAITDHSKRVTIAHGMDEKRLRRQLDAIDRLNARLDGIRVLKGVEVDILADGTLDLSDSVLRHLDLTIGAIHSGFTLSRDKQSERIIRAMDNPHFNILAHPTGRLINQRPGYEIDMERVMEAALERGCYLELNAQPDRLDLHDVHCRMAKDMGLKLAISTDAHTTSNLEYMRFGVDQGRRGWLEPEDVLNTRSWRELKKLLARP